MSIFISSWNNFSWTEQKNERKKEAVAQRTG